MSHDSPHPHRDAEGFSYTYSAQKQAEIQKLRDKYRPASPAKGESPDKLTRLYELDAAVTRKGTVLSLVIGILSTLIMGFGMSLIMTDLGTLLHLTHKTALWSGVAVGMIGMVGVILAYPLWHMLTEKERRRAAPEIRRLCDELLGEGISPESDT